MKYFERVFLFLVFLALPLEVWAADSYRWLRVTIETPWAIFIFLLPMVLIPIVLMAILYWRYAGRPTGANDIELKKKDSETLT